MQSFLDVFAEQITKICIGYAYGECTASQYVFSHFVVFADALTYPSSLTSKNSPIF